MSDFWYTSEKVWCQSSGWGVVNKHNGNRMEIHFTEGYTYYAEYDLNGHVAIIMKGDEILEVEKYRSLFHNPQECVDYIKENQL